jgi:diguanylate cyclase
MRYDDSVDESRHFLRLALEQIGKFGLPTDPINYCIWYEYASGKNAGLNHAIDSHLKQEQGFTQKAAQQVFKRYIAGKAEMVNELIRNELKKLFAEIVGAINATDEHFSESENHLETISDSLASRLSEAEIEHIVGQIKNEIQSLESSSAAFKNQLQQAAHEIEQLKSKMAQYRDEALKDPLTRINNRRGFDRKMEAAMDEARVNGTALCMIVADIDHFKKVNDTHGHLVGDNVIRMVAAAIKDSIKGRDMVARVGGEEFAVLLPDTPFEGALKLAENVRLTFERLDLKKKNTGESLGKITLSFGVTLFKTDESADAFFNRADEALYQSKNSGRNKVTGL